MTDGEGTRILLIEDESAHAELVQRAFEDWGNHVQLMIASTLAEARTFLLSYSPQLIIADWRLPDGDSIELLTASQENPIAPVVIMTSHGNERIAVEAIKAGALDYVVKSDTTLLDMPHIAEKALREWNLSVEQQRMEKALRESEERFRLLAENSTDIIARYTPDGRYLYVSPASHAILGYDPEELVGHSAFDWVHAADLDRGRKYFSSLLENRPLVPVTYRTRRKDGSYVWLETTGRVILDDTGNIVEFHASSRNVTDRVLAEQERRASEERFRSLVQNSDDLIVVVDADRRITYESPSVTRILGYEPNYSLGKDPLAFLHADDLPDAGRALQAISETTETGLLTEVRCRHASGEWIYLEVLGTNLLDHPGIRGIVLTARDVTQRKRSEIELQNAHSALAQAYEATIEGWSRAMDLRDRETEGHTLRVTRMTLDLARALDVPEERIVHIRRGALLHDMGKMGVPDHILQKPGTLSEEEWLSMRKHPEYAYQMLSDIEYLRPALNIPYYHHEWWDGTGYPNQLSGEAIPLEARLFSVVDAWDALSFDRPYRKAWPKQQVLSHLRDQAGRQFDPQVVEVFLQLLENLESGGSDDSIEHR